MRRFSDLDEVRSSVGEHLGHSDWHQVTQKQIDLFAEATGDHQWIHVDAARAATKSPFGTTIARGYLTLSLALMLVAEIVAARPADPSDPETYRAGRRVLTVVQPPAFDSAGARPLCLPQPPEPHSCVGSTNQRPRICVAPHVTARSRVI